MRERRVRAQVSRDVYLLPLTSLSVLNNNTNAKLNALATRQQSIPIHKSILPDLVVVADPAREDHSTPLLVGLWYGTARCYIPSRSVVRPLGRDVVDLDFSKEVVLLVSVGT